MKAVVFSIGESTTELCVWSLERNGFEVELWSDNSSLWAKLKRAYFEHDQDFLRVDADIIPNRNLTPALLNKLARKNSLIWWWQFTCFDWFKQDLGHNGINFIRKPAIAPLRANIESFRSSIRPETDGSRIREFFEPRRFDTDYSQIMGLHGYHHDDIERVKTIKRLRKQYDNYDWVMAERLDKL